MVCKIFEYNERSLKRWIEGYEQNKSVDRKSRMLGSYKIKKEHIKFIKETIENNNDIHIKNKFKDLDISKQYIHDLMRDNNITRKRVTFEHYPKTYRGNPRLNAIEQFFSQIKNYLKLYKSKNFEELKLNLKKTIKNIKKEHNNNYFIYAYNKDSYKNKKDSKKSSKHRKLKIYKD